MVVSALAWGWLLVTGGTIAVRGETSCPQPAAVSERIRSMGADEGRFPSSSWIELSEAPRGGGNPRRQIEVRLREPGRSPSATLGVISVSRTCDDAANDLAVVVAAWLAAYDTPPVAELAAPVPVSTVAPAPPETRATDVAPAALPRNVAVNASVNEMVTAEHEVMKATPPARSFPPQLGVAAGVVDGTTAGATVQAAVDLTVPVVGSWLARLALSGSGERALAVQPGKARWRRYGATVSGGRRSTFRDAFIEAAVGLSAAASRVTGSGFSSNDSDDGLDVGVLPAARVGWRPRRFLPEVWLELGATIWLRPHVLTVGGTAATGKLPGVDGVAMVGTSWSLGR